MRWVRVRTPAVRQNARSVLVRRRRPEGRAQDVRETIPGPPPHKKTAVKAVFLCALGQGENPGGSTKQNPPSITCKPEQAP